MTTPLPLYQRTGECLPSACGSACCRFLALEVNPIYLVDPDLARWVALHGVEIVRVGDRVVARIDLACGALTECGRCAVYGTPDRPQLCADFPQHPAALVGLDRCGYRFDEVPA